MYLLAFIIALVLLSFSVPVFLVFGIGSSIAAILGLSLPWSVLIQVSFGALTKHILIAVPLLYLRAQRCSGVVPLRDWSVLRLL